jgi:hypothetical protein
MPITEVDELKYVDIPALIVIILTVYYMYQRYYSVPLGMLIMYVFASLSVIIHLLAYTINDDEEEELKRDMDHKSYLEQHASIEAAKHINEEWANQI